VVVERRFASAGNVLIIEILEQIENDKRTHAKVMMGKVPFSWDEPFS
jgi:hypothetical protein